MQVGQVSPNPTLSLAQTAPAVPTWRASLVDSFGSDVVSWSSARPGGPRRCWSAQTLPLTWWHAGDCGPALIDHGEMEAGPVFRHELAGAGPRAISSAGNEEPALVTASPAVAPARVFQGICRRHPNGR